MISFDLNISGTVSATYGTLIVLAISFGVAAIGISFKEWIVKCLETSIVFWRSFALLRPALDEGEKNQLLPALLQVQSHNFHIREEGIKNLTKRFDLICKLRIVEKSTRLDEAAQVFEHLQRQSADYELRLTQFYIYRKLNISFSFLLQVKGDRRIKTRIWATIRNTSLCEALKEQLKY